MSDFVTGFMFPFRSIALLWKPGIRAYVIWPLLLNIAIFGLVILLSGMYFDALMDEYFPADAWWDFFRPLLWVLFYLVYAFFLFFGFTILANFLAAPFNSVLSSRIEAYLTGKAPESDNRSALSILSATLLSELNKLFYFLSRIIPLLILFFIAFFIPGLNLVVSVLWVLFGFWFLALEYTDYPMANHNIEPVQQRRKHTKSRFRSLGFGTGVAVMLMIPIVGFVAMPIAVAGATRYWSEHLSNSS